MYAGFLGVTDPPWPSRVKPIESTQAFREASDRSSLSVSWLKYERGRLEREEAALNSLLDRRFAERQAVKQKMLLETAEVQRKQIEETKTAKELQWEQRKVPGISPNYQGYPSIPETPPEVQQKRKLCQQKRLREALERQQEASKAAEKERRQEEREASIRMILEAEKVGRDKQRQEEEKRNRIREEMRGGWRRAMDYRNARSVVDSFTRSFEASPTSIPDSKAPSKSSLSVSTSLKAAIPPPSYTSTMSLTSKPTKLTDIQRYADRKQLAEKLKEREEIKARKSLAEQIKTHYKTYSLDISAPLGASFDYLPGLIKGKFSHLRCVRGLQESKRRNRRRKLGE